MGASPLRAACETEPFVTHVHRRRTVAIRGGEGGHGTVTELSDAALPAGRNRADNQTAEFVEAAALGASAASTDAGVSVPRK
eukprot:1434076-Prymnesium_polylepis.2